MIFRLWSAPVFVTIFAFDESSLLMYIEHVVLRLSTMNDISYAGMTLQLKSQDMTYTLS